MFGTRKPWPMADEPARRLQPVRSELGAPLPLQQTHPNVLQRARRQILAGDPLAVGRSGLFDLDLEMFPLGPGLAWVDVRSVRVFGQRRAKRSAGSAIRAMNSGTPIVPLPLLKTPGCGLPRILRNQKQQRAEFRNRQKPGEIFTIKCLGDPPSPGVCSAGWF